MIYVYGRAHTFVDTLVAGEALLLKVDTGSSTWMPAILPVYLSRWFMKKPYDNILLLVDDPRN